MPLLGAIGNASEYSFRGTYDNNPTISLNDLVNVNPGGIYETPLISIRDINYKVPISISGDGEYYIQNTNFKKVFNSTKITFDQTSTTFDADFPLPIYDTQSSYVRPNDIIGLRIFGVPPKIVETSLTIVSRTPVEYSIPLTGNISFDLRSGTYNLPLNGSTQIDDRAFQGTGVGTEFYGRSYNTTITIGKEQYTWKVTTKQAESPINLSFNNVTNAQYSTEIISGTYVVSGLNPSFNYRAEILSSEGTFSTNYNDFSTSAIVNNSDILRLKVNSSGFDNGEKSVTFRISVDGTNGTIGSASTSWSVRTLDGTPSNLFFNSVLNAPLKSQVFSETIIITGLSNGIDFDVNVISGRGTLSVNGSGFITSAKIRNGDRLQLQLITSNNWLESDNTVIRLGNTSTTWFVANRSIVANSDPNASYLIYAFPLERINQFRDASPEVRTSSSLSLGLRSTASISSVTGRSNPSILSEQSKYYLSSYKLAKGTTTKQFEVNYLSINTDSTQALGLSDFTIEMWIRASEFGFGGEVGMSIFYPSYIDSRNANDYFFQLFLKGDNWANTFGFKRGILLGYPDQNGIVRTICETSYQVFTVNTWHHVALTRSGSSFFIWVDGVNVASGSRSMNLTSTRYNYMIPNFQRLISGDFYVQDLRLYRGLAKYTSRFNPNTSVTPIMDQYVP
jgi:hypothetical protein